VNGRRRQIHELLIKLANAKEKEDQMSILENFISSYFSDHLNAADL
jgi:hypothetical protein